MDNVYCDGSESNLSECDHLGLGAGRCVTREEAEVVCTSMSLIGNTLH